MPLVVFLFLFLIAMWGVAALSYEAGQRWPVIGRMYEEGLFLVGLAVLMLLAILLGAIGIEIK